MDSKTIYDILKQNFPEYLEKLNQEKCLFQKGSYTNRCILANKETLIKQKLKFAKQFTLIFLDGTIIRITKTKCYKLSGEKLHNFYKQFLLHNRNKFSKFLKNLKHVDIQDKIVKLDVSNLDDELICIICESRYKTNYRTTFKYQYRWKLKNNEIPKEYLVQSDINFFYSEINYTRDYYFVCVNHIYTIENENLEEISNYSYVHNMLDGWSIFSFGDVGLKDFSKFKWLKYVQLEEILVS